MAKRARHYWLMKSEPDAFSIDDLQNTESEPWDGVRNYQARNFMREMRPGDLMLFYHSNAKPSGVAGIGRIVSEPYADPTQFDPDSKYYDPKATKDEPRWQLVDVEFVEKLDEVLDLKSMKEDPGLAEMLVTRKGSRLSITPVDKKHFKRVLKLAKATTKVR